MESIDGGDILPRKGIAMSLTKEFFDSQAYLPEESTNQLELIGLLQILQSCSNEDVHHEIATPLKPLSNEVFSQL